MNIKTTLTLAACLLGATSGAEADDLNTLRNLERERSAMLVTALDTGLTPAERREDIRAAARRLIDMERMAIRDDRLAGHSSPLVKACFDNYDRCFLTHASAEAGRTVADHWLAQLGLTTDALGVSTSGYR